ncbi:protease S8 tripeptidyl peptidase I, putative [Cordyceps militaris CM01]|uniref:tripeptidyl-peptidase II n=1 Tax=Cordyceps militaris (strain CM01) TaxID=983644 RepID=G3JFL2_CORMM|nr:protease S8 tripeptidyl peptidase I, putative [Cordyceps militaris CM01]EGX93586.1 protease S8 tripeptidyl peptidase I, putative [Cordyceps militaris CM01]
MRVTALFVNAFIATSLGMPSQHVQHERRSYQTVVKRAAARSSVEVPVRIALKQRNLERGMDLLMEVSDPSSAKYGQHYSPEQVVDTFAPDESSFAAVKKWLVEAGIPEASITQPKSRGWVDFRTTVGNLESLLKTSYHVYHGKRSGARYLGADRYSLPRDISNVVDFVHPAVSMSQVVARDEPRKRRRIFQPMSSQQIQNMTRSLGLARGCDRRVTPACIKDLYRIPHAPNTTNPKNRLGIFETDDEEHKQSDLDLFFSRVATHIPAGTGPKIDLIDWGTDSPNPDNAEGEAALDFDMVYPIIYPQTTELYQTRTQGREGFLNQFLDAVDGSYCTRDGGDDPVIDGITPDEMCGKFEPAPVISFSYGWQEQAFPAKYLERQCSEWMKLGLQGTTVVFASGDGGVAGNHGGTCQGSDDSIFTAIAASGCPYTTSVGATMVAPGRGVRDPEHVADQFSPGGGFSNVFAQPAYQQSAVERFFAYHDPGFPSYNTSGTATPPANITDGIYNRNGRGFPDLAANGLNGVVAFNGRVGTSGGTSQAAPIVAAIFTRLNEERLAAGKSVLGFVNPALYMNPAMFHDITIGGMGKDSDGSCGGKSWDAAPGWDPVTGLGTPNYPAMSKYFASI